MSVTVKICGVRNEAALEAAACGGAAFVGFVFVPKSRRYIEPALAGKLAKKLPNSVQAVGLFENPTDEKLLEVLEQARLDILQLHAQETPERVKEIQELTGLQVMKAIHVGSAQDFAQAAAYEAVSDMLLFDTKVSAEMLGGTGKSFDWSLMKGLSFSKPWMLAGGLNAGNLAEAVAMTGARIVDLSSGVEGPDGEKNTSKIRELLALAAKLP